jgi:hypothetical protein
MTKVLSNALHGVGKLFERKPLRFASSKCFLRATKLPLEN